MQKVLCLATLLVTASAQINQLMLVPTLYDQLADVGVACGDGVDTYRASVGNCVSYNVTSMRFRAPEYLTDCEDEADAIWYMDYYSGSTDCTGTATVTTLASGECYRFDYFSVMFTTTLGTTAACQLAGIQEHFYGNKLVSTSYNSSATCSGTPVTVEETTVVPFTESTEAVSIGAAQCDGLCDGFCCRKAADDCTLESGSYKQMVTCYQGVGVFATETYTDNVCATLSTSEEYVATRCTEETDTTSTYSIVSPSMEAIGDVCKYTPTEGALFVSESSEVLAIVTSSTFETEITAGSTILATIESAGSPALSLLVAVAALCAVML